jgi:hypothetical protein
MVVTPSKWSGGLRLRWKVCNTAAVAQRIRASVYGTEGRGFESLQPHQKLRSHSYFIRSPQI